SGGKKKYFFAYGLGKRKDGKGDGALLVDRKKLKPEEAEEDLEKANQTFSGTCWASPDGETVYFAGKGKKLSSMIVAKMALSAKRQAGKRYDFQVASEEDEAKADALGEEAPGDAPPPAPPPPPPPAPQVDAAQIKERIKKATAQLVALKRLDPARAQSLSGLLMQAASLVQMSPPQLADAGLRLDELE